jgi:hypothetical protein
MIETSKRGRQLVEDFLKRRGFSVYEGDAVGVHLIADNGSKKRLVNLSSRRINRSTTGENAGVLIKHDQFEKLRGLNGAYFARVMILPHKKEMDVFLVSAEVVPTVFSKVQHSYRKDIEELLNDPRLEHECYDVADSEEL